MRQIDHELEQKLKEQRAVLEAKRVELVDTMTLLETSAKENKGQEECTG